MSKSCVIIGGGIGGLFSGAFLSRNGYKVTVLEKNATVGGGLQCFRKKGKIFETGMHVMGGWEHGGNLSKICSYLGILDKLNIHHLDSDCMDEIHYVVSDEVFRIPSGREQFIKRLSGYFPEETDGIRKYVDQLYALTDELPLFNMRESTESLRIHSEKFLWPSDRLIGYYIKDHRLREILAYLNPIYGGRAGVTPAYIHAIINVLYINGTSRFVKGSQQLVDALLEIICNGGGGVYGNCEVSSVAVSGDEVKYVELLDGRRFDADWYISAVHPVEMLRLLPEGTFNKAYVTRLNELPNSYSAFSLYIDLKPDAFPYIDHTCYYVKDYGEMWRQDKFDIHDWPKIFMYMTPPDENQGKYAGRMLVHCIMSYGQVRKWEATTVGNRGADYELWKKECTDKIIDRLESLYTGFRCAVAEIYSSSPLTIRDYYHTKEGSMFGYVKDCNNIMLSQLSPQTKVRNLLLTGQNIHLHGICGVSLTAILTAETLLGRNTLVKQINHASANT